MLLLLLLLLLVRLVLLMLRLIRLIYSSRVNPNLTGLIRSPGVSNEDKAFIFSSNDPMGLEVLGSLEYQSSSLLTSAGTGGGRRR